MVAYLDVKVAPGGVAGRTDRTDDLAGAERREGDFLRHPVEIIGAGRPPPAGDIDPQHRAKMIVEGVMSGMHRSPYQGMAVEFAQHRPYVAGDDIRHVDWKVLARKDRLFVKQYEEETNLRHWVVLDTSASIANTPIPCWTKSSWMTALFIRSPDPQAPP